MKIIEQIVRLFARLWPTKPEARYPEPPPPTRFDIQ